MSKKKCFTKLCQEYHTFFEGYQVPVGAIYGRSIVHGEELFWVVTDYTGLPTGKLLAHFMKRSWLSNHECHVAKMTWHTTVMSCNSDIYKEVLSLVKTLGNIPKVTSYVSPKRRLSREDHKEILLVAGQKKAQGEFVFRCRPQGGDNADQGCSIKNQNSYWECQKDMMRNVCNYGGDIYGRP